MKNVAIVRKGYVHAGTAFSAEGLEELIRRGTRHDLRFAEPGEKFVVATRQLGHMSCGYYDEASIMLATPRHVEAGLAVPFPEASAEAERINAASDRKWAMFLAHR